MALGVVLLLFLFFVATLPFAWIQGAAVPSLILVLHTILAINDLITSVLLFGQYWLARPRRLNVLAGGYLFTAVISIPYVLSFPGIVSEPALVYGDRSAPWLYVAWHAGLSVAVIAYAFPSRRASSPQNRNGALAAVVSTVTLALVAVAALSLLATVGSGFLPAIGVGRKYSAAALIAIDGLLALTAAAMLFLARRRPYTTLDLWLMVVMFAWLCSIVLGAAIGTVRYDIGYDVSRLFAVLASTFVLTVLLLQIGSVYARTIADRERRLNEVQAVLVHTSRVNELGLYISTFIHEVIQPLTAAANYLAAGVRLPNDTAMEQVKPLFERSAEQAARALAIVRQLRSFVARRESEMRAANIPEMLQNAISLALAASGGEPPTIRMQCNPAAAFAFINRVQIEQVVFNLVLNAIEAMADSPRRALTFRVEPTSNNMVEVSVADTGPGLSPAIRARLFEPFVTTKAGGLGIGLSICQAIIQAHGGELEAGATSEGGAVFRFTLRHARSGVANVTGV